MAEPPTQNPRLSKFFNVKTYGAAGDGSTDDTTAISSAISAIPSTGGVLYFPASPSTYKVTSGFTLSKPVTVQGDGGFGTASTSILGRSTISFSTTSGTLFTVTANGCMFKEIHLHNPSGTAPTVGAGISVTSNGQFTRYQSITVSGFYINIDHQTGELSTWENCFLTDPILYDLKLQNTNTFDGGDWSIKGCNFNTSRAAISAIRLESGGGLKITNTKINANAGANVWTNGIDVRLGASVVSGDLLISNCSIEGYGGSGSGIKLSTLDGSSFYRNIIIDGVQFGAFGTTNSGSAVSVASTVANQFMQLIVSGCTAYASPTSTGAAYTFSNANTVRFDPNNIAVGYTQLVSFTNTSNTNYEYRNPQLADGAMAYGVSVTNPSTAYNASPLSGVGLATVYDSSGNTAGMGGFSIGKQNAASGDYQSFLSLYTRMNGANITENLRVAPDSSLYTDGAIKFNLQVVNQTVYNSSPLSGIVFQNKYTSGGALAGMGGIAVGKANSTDGEYGSFLAFYARTNGSSLAEFGRFSTSGGFSVGSTTDPGAGGLLLAGILIGTPQALSGAGAVNITTLSTAFTSTGGAQALTLANGTAGQIKTICHVVDGGSGVLTPTTKSGYSTITFTNAGDSVTLQYHTTAGWCIVGSYGVTIA